MRVSVDSEALDAFVRYADDKRMSSDSEFLCSKEEERASKIEFEDLVAALEIRA